MGADGVSGVDGSGGTEGMGGVGGVGGFTARALIRRFEQFFEESEVIIPAFATALEGGDWPALGALVGRSQSLTTSHLGNTTRETEWLPACAEGMGAIAASAFGAGFGGSCWALVRAELVCNICGSEGDFRESWVAGRNSVWWGHGGREGIKYG